MSAGAALGAGLLTLSAAAAATLGIAAAFPDVAGHWALRPIAQLRAAGWLRGSDGRFRPDQPATRAEVVRLLVTVAGAEDAARELQSAPPTFADVRAGDWVNGYVEAAAERDLVRGFDDGTFRADRALTRAELAVLLARALNWTAVGQALSPDPAATLPATFRDGAEIPGWARDAVAAAAAGGWLVGDERGRFRPSDPVLRAELAAVIARVARARGLFDLRGAWTGWDARAQAASIDGRAWPLAPGAIVFGDLRPIDPASIRAGDWIQAITDANGRLAYLETVPYDSVGWLVGVDGTGPRLTVWFPPEGGTASLLTLQAPLAGAGAPAGQPAGATAPSAALSGQAPAVPGLPAGWTQRAVEVDRDAAVYRGGRRETIGSLRAGDRVYVALDRATGRARVVDAVAVDLQGQLLGVEVDAREISHVAPGASGAASAQSSDPPATARIAAASEPVARTRVAVTARIFVDGSPAELSALRGGDRFLASLSPAGEIDYLEVRR